MPYDTIIQSCYCSEGVILQCKWNNSFFLWPIYILRSVWIWDTGRVELVKRVGYIVRTNIFTLYMNPLNNGPKTEVKQVSDCKQKEQKTSSMLHKTCSFSTQTTRIKGKRYELRELWLVRSKTCYELYPCLLLWWLHVKKLTVWVTVTAYFFS